MAILWFFFYPTRVEHTIYRTQGEYAHHFTTDAIQTSFLMSLLIEKKIMIIYKVAYYYFFK
jgi:hypothetical protein